MGLLPSLYFAAHRQTLLHSLQNTSKSPAHDPSPDTQVPATRCPCSSLTFCPELPGTARLPQGHLLRSSPLLLLPPSQPNPPGTTVRPAGPSCHGAFALALPSDAHTARSPASCGLCSNVISQEAFLITNSSLFLRSLCLFGLLFSCFRM